MCGSEFRPEPTDTQVWVTEEERTQKILTEFSRTENSWMDGLQVLIRQNHHRLILTSELRTVQVLLNTSDKTKTRTTRLLF